LARQEVVISPTFRHLEVFTMRGLLTVLWHGDPDAEAAVVLGGGAMGGLLGPADGFYHWLGEELAVPGSGIGVLRVGWRRPNDLDLCTLDLLAAADLAARAGAVRFVTGGHSFGGAIAVRAGIAMGDWTRGVLTFATQSAGCEGAGELGAPLLAYHGDRDELLPVMASEVVSELAGGPAEVRVCEGAGHLLSEAGDQLRVEVPPWIRERIATGGGRCGPG
jgi:pimeloyl-ACP methyl ester carboxylesterase